MLPCLPASREAKEERTWGTKRGVVGQLLPLANRADWELIDRCWGESYELLSHFAAAHATMQIRMQRQPARANELLS
jgi:hypothetical protein